jgi:dienelactone hydrolase
MGLQTLNAVRGLDFLLTLPEVDPARVAITGASGGGTQTMLLAAIDDRIKLSFPCVMVSTAMQGGCTCENASLLRINTGNVEFAGLFAPKPQGMNTADDWTKEFATKGFPELQSLYQMYGKKNQLFLLCGEHFPHNYNAVTRSAFYTFLNKHFKLSYPEPVIEQDYEPLSRDQLTVWNADHPAPKAADPEFERQLLKWLAIDSSSQLEAAAATPDGIAKIIRPAVEIVLGRTFANAGTVKWLPGGEPTRGDIQEMAGTIRNQTHGEEVRVLWLQPKQWNGRVVIWLGDDGKSTVQTNAEVKRLLAAGVAVVGADLFEQGAERIKQTRIVENPREVAAFTHGYNHSLFAQRVHDVLTLVTFLRNPPDNFGPRPQSVCLVGWGETGAVAVAARALAGKAIDRAAIDIGGFRFGTILDYRDPAFLPGGAKYLDLPGLILLNADLPLWQRVDSPEPAVEWLLK